MTLGDIKTKLTALVNRRDFTADTALQGTFIDQAIMRIQRELRAPLMEKSVNVTIATGYAGLVIPNDMLELISIIPAATNDRIDKRDITEALKEATYTGTPRLYARQGGLWVLGPSPAINDVIRVDYYAEFPALVSDTDSNILTTVGWDLLLYAAAVPAGIHFRDKKTSDWEAAYQDIKMALQSQSDNDELDGTTQVLPTYRWPDEYEGCGY